MNPGAPRAMDKCAAGAGLAMGAVGMPGWSFPAPVGAVFIPTTLAVAGIALLLTVTVFLSVAIANRKRAEMKFKRALDDFLPGENIEQLRPDVAAE